MNFEELEKILKIKITNEDEETFIKAFTHRSFLNENRDKDVHSNERLEFLGDSVLQFLSSKFLFEKYTENPEGDLTAFRASIVNTNSLGTEAKRLGYGEFLRLSKGEEANGGREREYILANTFEAVLGAMVLTKGLDTCKKFLEENLFYKIDNIVKSGEYKDKKSLFQELVQEKDGVTPTYNLVKSWGPDHDKKFEVAVFINERKITTGVSTSKQKAEIEAAANAIWKEFPEHK